MAKKKWNDLTSRQKQVIVATAAIDAGLRVWAGRDLSGRSRDEVNGPKWLWGLGLSTINSFGVVPVVYLLRGRRKAAVAD